MVGVDAVIDGVRRCWRALFNDQAMITRAATRRVVDPAMAVIIQELVPLARSGRAYTIDPIHQRNDLVRITACFHRDDSVRLVRPPVDSYVVTRSSDELVELHVGDKMDDARRYQRVLSDAEASLVASTALQIERCLGRPVAVEWSLSTDATVMVLQAETIGSSDRRLPLAG